MIYSGNCTEPSSITKGSFYLQLTDYYMNIHF